MANTHVQPDTTAEVNSIHADLLAPAVLAATWAVPPSSMTLAPFEVYGYVNVGTPARLTYVYQEPVSLALTGGDGAYWVALHVDTFTPVSGWTRRVGSHYLWQQNATRPADPPGGLVALSVTVAGGVITAIDGALAYPAQKLAVGGGRGQLTYSPLLTWDGTILRAPNVAASNQIVANSFFVADHAGNDQVAFHTYINAAGGTNRWSFVGAGTAPALFGGAVTVSGSVTVAGASTLNGTLAVMWPLQANYELTTNRLYAAGASVFNNGLTVNQALTATGAVTVGVAGIYNAGPMINAGFMRIGDNVYPGYTLDVNGNAYIRVHAGIGAVPLPGQYHLNAGNTQLQTLSVASSAIMQSAFQVNGTSALIGNVSMSNNLAVAMGFQPGWRLSALDGFFLNALYSNGSLNVIGAAYFSSSIQVSGDSSLQNVWTGTLNCSSIRTNNYSGFGYDPAGGYWIRAGRTWVDDLSIGGPNGGWTLWNVGSMYTGANSHLAGRVDMAADARVYANLAVGAVEPGAEGFGFHCTPNGKFRSNLNIDYDLRVGANAWKPGGGPFTDSSSRQYKTAITPIVGALALLLAQQGVQYEWSREPHRTLLPGPQYGLVAEDVTIPQWRETDAEGEPGLCPRGSEALVIEALREIVTRLEALERAA